jgi:hypothetical protein
VNDFYPPVINAPLTVAAAVHSLCIQKGTLENLERMACAKELQDLPFFKSSDWLSFSLAVRQTFVDNDHLIIKGLPVNKNGATLLLASLTVASIFRTYRGTQIIKHFKMSPWTNELSHTTKKGEFHTDLNTEPYPPAVTAMQCLDADPGAPQYGVSAVARVSDLISFLRKANDLESLQFLTQETVTMLNDRASSSWSGQVVDGDIIRYHPETLRAANRRLGRENSELERKLDRIARAAAEVSVPFILEPGDILLLSNHRTLHYRGECSVVFTDYPMKFDSRSVFILHATDELKVYE